MNLCKIILLAAFIIVFAVRDAEGQVPGNHFAFGSTNIVADHAAQMTDQFWLNIYQDYPDGSETEFVLVQDIRGFTNIAVLNSWLQTRCQKFATNVLSATNIDFGQQFKIYASAQDMKDGFYTVAFCYHPFYLVQSNGQYYVPDFSSLSMQLESDMPYRVTNIDWAVMQVYDLSSNLVDVLDSRYQDPSLSIVDKTNQILDLPTAYLTGTNVFRLIVVSGTNYEHYGVFGAQGNQIPEILPRMTAWYNKTNQTQNVTVITGDVGRYLAVQVSSDLVNWTNVTGGYITYYIGYDPGFSYLEMNSLKSGARFFRIDGESGPY